MVDPTAEGTANVHGHVVAADGSPMPGLSVKAFDKTLHREILLGEATTTRAGTYLIGYSFESRGDLARALDLIVRAYDPGAAANVAVLKNAIEARS